MDKLRHDGNWIGLIALVSGLCFGAPLAYGEDSPGEIAQKYVVGVESTLQRLWGASGIKDLNAKSPHVRFTVLPNGSIKNVSISETSTIANVDARAMEIVKEGSPFAPLPAVLLLKQPVEMDIELRINYVTNDQKAVSNHAHELLDRARDLVSKGHIDDAIKLLQDSDRDAMYLHRELTAELSDLYYNQARLMFDKDPHSAQALELAKKSLELHPTSTTQDLINRLNEAKQ